jgi:hypothetical protein
MLYDDTFKKVVLQAKCKELGLSYAGRKADLIERLNDFAHDEQEPAPEP